MRRFMSLVTEEDTGVGGMGVDKGVDMGEVMATVVDMVVDIASPSAMEEADTEVAMDMAEDMEDLIAKVTKEPGFSDIVINEGLKKTELWKKYLKQSTFW